MTKSFAVPDAPPVGSAATEPAHASPGQVLVMFAVFATAMLGMLGMAVDLGFAFSERRTMQSGADLAAIAGTRIVAKSASISGLSAAADVQTVVNGNKIGANAPTIAQCAYVNDAGTALGTCGTTVPSGATGVRATLTETHPTFFIRAIPGAPNTVTTRATATARVRILSDIPADGPFLVCGVNTKLESGGNLSMTVQQASGSWQINPAAIGQTFKIHGPQIEKCNAKASRYKGVADQGQNRHRSAPPAKWFNYEEGDTAGPVAQDVEGIEGCQAGQVVDNCVVFLPVVVNSPPEEGNNRQLWCVGFAPFLVTITGANTHSGKLIGSYIVKGPGSDGWTPGYMGPVIIKLVV